MDDSVASILLRTVRRRAAISQAELARRAGMPRSVVNAYERGSRQPSADALQRLARAAGAELAVGSATGVDVDQSARVLEQVLELAESLPFRRARAMTYPRFTDRARPPSR